MYTPHAPEQPPPTPQGWTLGGSHSAVGPEENQGNPVTQMELPETRWSRPPKPPSSPTLSGNDGPEMRSQATREVPGTPGTASQTPLSPAPSSLGEMPSFEQREFGNLSDPCVGSCGLGEAEARMTR